MYSLRRTLAVRFSLTMLVALTLIAAWAFLGVHRAFREDLDRALNAALLLETDVLASGVPLASHTETQELSQFIEKLNRFVVLRDERGRIISSNTPLAAVLPLDTALFRAALRGEIRITTEPWGEQRFRSIYAPAPAAALSGGKVLQVAASLAPLEQRNRRLLFFMLGTVLLGTVATAFGASWLSNSALAPVAEITAQAESIEPGRTDHRITAHADASELASLVRVLNDMLERLDRALQAQRRIIADVGHDIRTPLTAMRGHVEVALRTPRTSEQYQAALRAVLEEIDYLTSISEAMILLARLESGAMEPRRESVDLVELADVAVGKIQPRSGMHRVELVNETKGEAPVYGDYQMLATALDQLLDNAIRHTPADARVEVRIREDGGGLALAVRDSGPGIPAEALPQMFERLSRGDEARSRTAGAGLGLTLARAIATAHHGRIRATNLPEGGFEVCITLPRAASTGSGASRRPAASPPTETALP